MSPMASQTTIVSIVDSTVCSGSDQTALYEGISPVTGEFPVKRASNTENVSIWWRHHETTEDNAEERLDS